MLTQSTNLVAASSQFWSVADTAPLSITGNHTFEAWIRIDTDFSEGQVQQLFTKDDITAWNVRSYGFSIRKSGGVYQLNAFIHGGGGSYNTWHGTFSYTLGTWVHVAAVGTLSNGLSTKYEFFRMGVSVGNGTQDTSTNITSIQNDSSSVRIGAFNYADYFFNGRVSEVRLWNDPRTSGELSANYNVELVGNEANLVGYWKFNGNGNDTTSNAANLTNNNSCTFVNDVPFGGSVFIPKIMIF